MSINETIRAAVTPTVKICVPNLYSGNDPVYCTFDYGEIPDMLGDDAPEAVRYIVQVHLFLPLSQNATTLKAKLKKALFMAGFTYPTVENATDDEYQHYVFECEIAEGV